MVVACFDRNSMALYALTKTIEDVGMGVFLDQSRCEGKEKVAKDLAELSFSIADAMIAKRDEGQSK